MRALLSCFSSFSLNLICKISTVELGEILGVFVNTLTGDVKYLVLDCENMLLPMQMNSLKNQKLFLNFLSLFWNLHEMLNILKKRMIVLANVFPKLQTVKILLRPLSKKRCYRKSLDSQDGEESQTLVKSPWESFRHVFPSFSGRLFTKMSPPVLGDIVVVFVNILTADAKYPIQDCENLNSHF